MRRISTLDRVNAGWKTDASTGRESRRARCWPIWMEQPANWAKAPYSRDYNELREGDALTVKTEKSAGFVSMLHVLAMDRDSRRSLQARRIPVTKAISGETLENAKAEAVQIERDGKSAVVILCHAEVISAVDMLSAGGYHGYGKLLVFTPQTPEGICLAW